MMGFFHQAPLDRIAMEIAQLLMMLRAGEDIEVVIPALPELLPFTLQQFGCLALENAQGGGQRVSNGF